MVVPYKGCGSSELELLYIHAPSIWCTLQCIISCTRRDIFFLSPNTFSFMIFQESICSKLGGTMKILEIKWNAFRKSISQSRPKTLYQKMYLCLQLVSRHNIFYWCQDTIGLKGVIDWGGARFHKFHGSSNVSLSIWSKYGYVSLNEFFMSFSINSKSFKNSYFSTHNHPPSWIEGEHKNLFQLIRKD